MKGIAALLIGTVILLAAGCSKPAGDNSNISNSTSPGPAPADTSSTSVYPKRYLVESGIVEYEMSGMQKGTETVYFDRWGWREAKYTNSEISIAGISRRESKLSLMDGEWLYTIDLERRTGTKTNNTLLPRFIEAAKRKDQSMTELGEEMMRNMGGEKMGTEQIAGKPCEIWVVRKMGSRTCVWNGVTLRTEVTMAGMQMTSTARRFEDNAGIPGDKFAIPGDVKIAQGPDVKQVLEGIKEKTKGR